MSVNSASTSVVRRPCLHRWGAEDDSKRSCSYPFRGTALARAPSDKRQGTTPAAVVWFTRGRRGSCKPGRSNRRSLSTLHSLVKLWTTTIRSDGTMHGLLFYIRSTDRKGPGPFVVFILRRRCSSHVCFTAASFRADFTRRRRSTLSQTRTRTSANHEMIG